jgi:O-antigen ligase
MPSPSAVPTRRRFSVVPRSAPDALSSLTIYLALLYAIPSNRSIPSLGSAGSISVLWGVGAAILWCLYHLQRTKPIAPPRVPPVQIALFIFLVATLASYVAAMTRALPADEVSVSDTGLIRLLAWAGILLLASDGIPTLDRFITLLRRTVIAGALIASLGIAQFITKQSFVDLITIPGLAGGNEYANVDTRGGLVRAMGTANHPLEYAMVLSLILPLALTLALHDKTHSALLRWLPTGVIVLGLALSGSRSAIIGLLAGVVVLIPTWSRAVRWRFSLAAAVFVAATYVVAPRIITNMRYLFLAIADDSSAASRAESTGLVARLFSLNPVFGRGFGTLLPQYRILDNQYLLLLVEVGVVGLLAFAGLIATAGLSALSAGRQARDPLTRDIGSALAGSVLAGVVVLSLFDALSFPQSAGSLFFVLGLCAAYWKLVRRQRAALEGPS